MIGAYELKQKGKFADKTLKAALAAGRALPPETPSVMNNFKEPLSPVKDGFGYYGTLTYDESRKFTQCHLCGYFFKQLGKHVGMAHGVPVRAFREEMGLPMQKSLTAPSAAVPNFERYAKMTVEEKTALRERLQSGRGDSTSQGRARQKSLYYKNLEGRCPAQLLDKIDTLAKELGRAPSYKEYQKRYGHATGRSVYSTYGSWNEALRLLELSPSKGGTPFRYDKKILLELLRDFQREYGREPMYSDCSRTMLPSAQTYESHFGTWSKAKQLLRESQ